MEILRSSIADAEEILRLQQLAYQSEAERYNDYNITPLKQTLAEITEQFKTHIFLKAVSENKIIGTVRAYEENGTCYIGRLAVDPKMQNQGVGKALMKEIEKLYRPKRYELFVPTKSDKNIYLYKKMGYAIYEKSKYGCGEIEIFYMEKINKDT
ncbi:MAG: GNAT family N-acetyltransferase [Candidatus Omnitrophica bacterium]|nr:GNAT family N-acetyltransferase [Candidatus Omnitrophota bacterium]